MSEKTTIKPDKRYSYSITEEGVLNEAFSDHYRGGRVEVYDAESDDGYAVYEWRFLLPSEIYERFYEFVDDLETDKPIMIQADFNMDTQEYEW